MSELLLQLPGPQRREPCSLLCRRFHPLGPAPPNGFVAQPSLMLMLQWFVKYAQVVDASITRESTAKAKYLSRPWGKCNKHTVMHVKRSCSTHKLFSKLFWLMDRTTAPSLHTKAQTPTACANRTPVARAKLWACHCDSSLAWVTQDLSTVTESMQTNRWVYLALSMGSMRPNMAHAQHHCADSQPLWLKQSE